MRRVTAVAVVCLLSTVCVLMCTSRSEAQNARQRQAAAQAYDRGTTAYVDQAYEEAARWFETANRLAPAAPALMQAIRAHERNDNGPRAATLALELQANYRDDSSAKTFAQGILDKNTAALLRVQVSCDSDCKLDVDGKLEEHLTFFVTAQVPHQLVATFESGSRSADLRGGAGETKELAFVAPPASGKAPLLSGADLDAGDENTRSRRPLSPLVTWIGIGVTAALGAATIISGVNANAGVPGYKTAAGALENCRKAGDMNCEPLNANATSLLEAGQSRETRTNILIGVTAAAAVGTSVLAIVLTDWSGSGKEDKDSSGGSEVAAVTASHYGHDESARHTGTLRARAARSGLASARLWIEPRVGGAATVFEGRF